MEKRIDPMHLKVACEGILTANNSVKSLYEKVKKMQPQVLAACPETEERVKGLLIGLCLAGLDGMNVIAILLERHDSDPDLEMATLLTVGLFGENPSMDSIRTFMTQFVKE